MTILLLSLLGCIDEVGCTAMAVYSTTVHVVGEDGEPIEGATLTFTLDGDGPQPCEELQGGDYVCGIEADGHFVIEGTAEGFSTETVEVDVAADECHPIPEAVTLTLSAQDCTAEEVPSVRVHLHGEGDEVLGDPQVSFQVGDAATTEPCDSADGIDWTCGSELTGEFTIDAVADGHAAVSRVVTVAGDGAGCHPVTEELDIALAWLPD